ncbi:DinB family protein [Deinococcus wulumuqiensis]|uniref:DinB family protein n=1 Tax=Deinococcus wulumuqiensis TaxID=980427 RepID=UPI00242E496B|nr:DinB family protein [Deinococcus wulumuqiensis]
MTLPDLLLETFDRNARGNDFLLDHLTDADLTLSDGRGGDTTLQLLSHMASARGGWLLDIGLSPEHASELQDLAGDVNLWEWQARGPAEVRAMLTAGDRAVLKAVQAHVQAGKPFADPYAATAFPSNPAQFLPYIVIHDSHHRGQIMALLRMNGRSKERMTALEELWTLLRQ